MHFYEGELTPELVTRSGAEAGVAYQGEGIAPLTCRYGPSDSARRSR